MQFLNEGFYSWLTADNDVSISNKSSKYGALPVKMLDDKGNEYIETDYEGYGVFGGKDYYDLMAEMNGMTREELNTGNYSYNDERLLKPKIVSLDCKKSYDELPDNKDDPSQGYFYETTMRDLINMINENNSLNEAWETKKFKTKEEMNKWIDKNQKDYEFEEIYINNAYGVEYRPLKKIDFDNGEELEESKLLGSINPYIRTHAKCNDKSFVFDGTTVDMVKQAIAKDCKEGDVIVTEDDTKYQIKLAPHDDRANGYWVDRIWNKNLKENETKTFKDYFNLNETKRR